MKTIFKYEITNFMELDKPIFIDGCDRAMIYKGIVKDKGGRQATVHWDKQGKCANELWNDFFIKPYDLIDYLNIKINGKTND